MKLKFKKSTAAGKQTYAAGKEYDVKDQHAAEVYVSHGYAEVVGTAPSGFGETLKRSHPAQRAKTTGPQDNKTTGAEARPATTAEKK